MQLINLTESGIGREEVLPACGELAMCNKHQSGQTNKRTRFSNKGKA